MLIFQGYLHLFRYEYMNIIYDMFWYYMFDHILYVTSVVIIIYTLARALFVFQWYMYSYLQWYWYCIDTIDYCRNGGMSLDDMPIKGLWIGRFIQLGSTCQPWRTPLKSDLDMGFYQLDFLSIRPCQSLILGGGVACQRWGKVEQPYARCLNIGGTLGAPKKSYSELWCPKDGQGWKETAYLQH